MEEDFRIISAFVHSKSHQAIPPATAGKFRDVIEAASKIDSSHELRRATLLAKIARVAATNAYPQQRTSAPISQINTVVIVEVGFEQSWDYAGRATS